VKVGIVRAAPAFWAIVGAMTIGIAALHAAEINNLGTSFIDRFGFASDQSSAALPSGALPYAGWPGNDPIPANAYASSLNPAAAGMNAASVFSGAARQYLLPSFGADAPEWAKRIEVEAELDRYFKPTYSILTVQPLYQNAGKIDTVFLQASQLRYDMFGTYRDTSNVGLGYRRLLFGNSMLVGANAFYDYEWTYGHSRYGLGGEVKAAMLDLNANVYRAITGYRTIDPTLGIQERAMSGWDVEARSQVPYLPWLRVGAQRYHWTSDPTSDVATDRNGWKFSADADITQNLAIEGGWRQDNYRKSDGFIKFEQGAHQ
jgi:hypothetical protein